MFGEAGGVMFSIRHNVPWTDLELQELYEVINDLDWFLTCRPFLPNRTDAAINTKMCQLRQETGIVPHRIGPKSISQAATEREKAKHGCDKLRLAILEAA